jgi:hypothetical protein
VAIVCLSVRLVRSTKNPMEQSSVLSCWLDMRDNLGGQLVRQSLNECIPKNRPSFFLFSLHACRSGLFTWLSMLMLFFDQTCDQGWCAQFWNYLCFFHIEFMLKTI